MTESKKLEADTTEEPTVELQTPRKGENELEESRTKPTRTDNEMVSPEHLAELQKKREAEEKKAEEALEKERKRFREEENKPDPKRRTKEPDHDPEEPKAG